MKRERFLGLVVAGAVIGAVAAPPARATLIASDTLIGTATRTTLVGTQTPEALTWGNLTTRFGKAGLNPATYPTSYGGPGLSLDGTVYVPFTASNYKSFSVEADVRTRITDLSMKLLDLVGFGDMTHDPLTSSGPGLYAAIDSRGSGDTWGLYANGNNAIATGDLSLVSGFQPNGYNHLQLAYDVGTATITLTIDNWTESFPAPESVTMQVNNFSTALLSDYNITSWSGTEFQNFELDAVVPEPNVVMLLGIGAAVLGFRRRMKAN